MRFYRIECNEDTNCQKMYSSLEKIGDFSVNNGEIVFCTKKNNSNIEKIFEDCKIELIKIDPMKYQTINKEIKEWLFTKYRIDKVERLLKQSEKEKQEDLKNLYGVIMSAEDILRKEDFNGNKQE